MNTQIRPAGAADIPAIIALLLEDAKTREALNPHLWAVASDAPQRISGVLETIENPVTGPFRHHWSVAETNGIVRAVTHGVNVPAPPIIDLQGGTAGVLLDDCHLPGDYSISSALVAETERAMSEAGAVLFVAASPQDWTGRTGLLEASGYEPTTLYMAKTGLEVAPPTGSTRMATEADLDGIVNLSALHRARLQEANSTFWHIHAEADARFGAWMKTSLSLPDRSMYVSGTKAIDGYIVAQPGSPLHFAPAHDAARTGLIDDFYATAFEPRAENSDPSGLLGLLRAAEASFHIKGIDTVLAICPKGMAKKSALLEEQGYRTANLWMVKGPLASTNSAAAALEATS